MVRVASGSAGQEDPNAALLQGMQMGRMFREAQADRAAAANAQAGRQIQMQELMLRMAKFKADRDDQLAKASSLGDLNALRKMAIRSHDNPVQEYAEIGQMMMRNASPEVQRQMYPVLKEILRNIETGEHKKALTGTVEDLLKMGVLDETGKLNYDARLAAGESAASLSNEANTLKQKHIKEQAIMEENQKALQGAPELIEASRPGKEQLNARSLLKEAELSPSKMTQPGYGAQVRQNIEAALISGRMKASEEQQKRRFKRTADVAKIIEWEMSGDPEKMQKAQALKFKYGAGGQSAFGPTAPPQAPGEGPSPWWFQEETATRGGEQEAAAFAPPNEKLRQQAARLRAEKERRYPGSTVRKPKGAKAAALPAGEAPVAAAPDLSQAKSPAELTEALKAAGLPKTPASVQAILERWRGGK